MILAILLTVAPLVFPIVMSALGLLTGMVQAYIFSILATVAGSLSRRIPFECVQKPLTFDFRVFGGLAQKLRALLVEVGVLAPELKRICEANNAVSVGRSPPEPKRKFLRSFGRRWRISPRPVSKGEWPMYFVGRLRKLSGAEKQALISATTTSAGLPPRQRLVLDAAVEDTLGPKTELRFETAPDLVSGVELTVNGHKLAWSIKDYLTSLADHVGEVLEKKAEQSAEPKPAPDSDAPASQFN